MDTVIKIVDGFNGIFAAGGENLVGLITGILPALAVVLITINSIISFVGEDKIQKFAKNNGKYAIVRYVILPFLAMFVLANPGSGTIGRFLEEEYKPGFCDCTAAMSHPMTSVFPHVNPAELFVWLGISQGITKLGLPTGELALRYLIAGLILAFFRGLADEYMFKFLKKRNTNKEVA